MNELGRGGGGPEQDCLRPAVALGVVAPAPDHGRRDAPLAGPQSGEELDLVAVDQVGITGDAQGLHGGGRGRADSP
jgi:hypothetical protein